MTQRHPRTAMDLIAIGIKLPIRNGTQKRPQREPAVVTRLTT
jgi:hypothetical protein